MESSEELIELLNEIDECSYIEAKKGSKIDRSIMETICAFSNEPRLGGGYLLLGVERDESKFDPFYFVTGIANSDKLQLDLSTQCASLFNISVRPEIKIEQAANGKNCLIAFIPELPEGQKPLFFKNQGLPSGAFRRIGSSDQRCTEDDLYVFYNQNDSLDSSIVKDTSLADIDEHALTLYRKFRENINPLAEELTYDDYELLKSLGCIKTKNELPSLTYTGLLVFGKKQALRRLLPMVRVDYIRVPGKEWVADPENRFTNIDMRGSLMELVQRAFNIVSDDLPKGFLLPDNSLQAQSVGLPAKVLREALVNAFIHRSYREHQPIQIIRYSNRIEIKNPGFSLKHEDELGEPGSKSRNPLISAIFHETNLAETKGTGIRTMRKLMDRAKMVPPTFESNHAANQFTIRLLLHHFLNEEDIDWLKTFHQFELNDAQKRALIFIRETGAIDNPTYRQLNGCDSLSASSELRNMRYDAILMQKGKGRATYYIPDSAFYFPHGKHNTLPYFLSAPVNRLSAPPYSLSAPVNRLSAPPYSLSAPVNQLSAPPYFLSAPTHLHNAAPTFPEKIDKVELLSKMPKKLQQKIAQLGKRASKKEIMEEVILLLCAWKPQKISELSALLERTDKYLLREFIGPMRRGGGINYTIPEMPNHPHQAYEIPKKKSKNHL